MLFVLCGYQVFLAPLVGTGCRFYPSCSHYAMEAVARHGARRGGWLALRRLLRCHPFSPGGYDPVPDSSLRSAAAHPAGAEERP
jgi:putative membrane protein insertion efficiency factor